MMENIDSALQQVVTDFFTRSPVRREAGKE